MYNISWEIEFKTDGKVFSLETVEAIEIECNVDNLTDTAIITLPETILNQVLDLEKDIKRGSQITIRLGYDGNLETEFIGYVLELPVSDDALKIKCEDALFLYRKSVKDIELKPTSLKEIAENITRQVDNSFTVICDFDISYEKFVIHQATGFDVLKKLAEETKANIYFNTEKKELHIHAPYIEKAGEVVYSMQDNIEKSSLEFKRAIDKKVEITVERTNSKGKIESYTTGTTGGDKITLKVGSVASSDLKKIADAELIRRSSDSYEGAIDTWLIPFVKPTFSAWFQDEDYPEKNANYYVTAVTTVVSESEDKRTVKFGVKLSV